MRRKEGSVRLDSSSDFLTYYHERFLHGSPLSTRTWATFVIMTLKILSYMEQTSFMDQISDHQTRLKTTRSIDVLFLVKCQKGWARIELESELFFVLIGG